ncbi:oxytocin receptor b [Salminus brasiliensis]|uniref:oxytocin receptor b n=1 Tax=Salminus brasiliensis TaxID=930266 RepID=UPI003B835562
MESPVSWALNASRNASSAPNPLKRDEEVAKVEVAVLVLVLLLAVVGNACVLAAVAVAGARKRGASRMHFFMKHLSIADLVVAVFQVLPQLIWDITFRFYGPDALCRLVKYLQVVGMFASTYVLVLMSVDRCMAVWRPLRALRRHRAERTYVLASWALSLVLSAPQACIFKLKEVGDGVYDCWGDFVQPWGAKAYVTWISLAVYVIPVTVLSVCYGLISWKVWQNFRLKTGRSRCTPNGTEVAAGAGAGALARVSSVRLISEAKMRTVKMTLVIVVAYIVCWTPFFFVQMWAAWDPMAPREAMAFIIAMLLASLNSCCNPWIYMFFAGHLFRDLMQSCMMALHCGCGEQQSPKSQSGAIVMKSTCSQRSLTQTTTT